MEWRLQSLESENAVLKKTVSALQKELAQGGSNPAAPDGSERPLTLQGMQARLRRFAAARDWDQYHTPRNLILAFVGEVGELAEIFQWRGEVPVFLQDWKEEDRVKVRDELADCFWYLVRLADRCGVDLERSWLEKMEKNEGKYPAELVRGSSKKYNEYPENSPSPSGSGSEQEQERPRSRRSRSRSRGREGAAGC